MNRKATLLFTVMSMIILSQASIAASSSLPAPDKDIKTKAGAGNASTSLATWEFYSAQKEPTNEELSASSTRHSLGKKVAYLYNTFKALYVVKEEVVPGDPLRRTVIRKPEIYHAVRSVEKSLTRGVKRGELDASEAEAELTHVLKVALAALDTDTESFEAALQDHKKDSSTQLAVFQHVHLKNIY